MLWFTLTIIGSVVSWHRTLIPVQVDGVVRDLVIYEIDQPGVDDWVELRIGGRRIVVGNEALRCVKADSTLHKAAWSRMVEVNGTECMLPLPRQALTDTLLPLAIFGGFLVVSALKSRSGKPTDPRDR
nr:hypothetical protein GCM10023233_00790 [Brevibacterium otitidis]